MSKIQRRMHLRSFCRRLVCRMYRRTCVGPPRYADVVRLCAFALQNPGERRACSPFNSLWISRESSGGPVAAAAAFGDGVWIYWLGFVKLSRAPYQCFTQRIYAPDTKSNLIIRPRKNEQNGPAIFWPCHIFMQKNVNFWGIGKWNIRLFLYLKIFNGM